MILAGKLSDNDQNSVYAYVKTLNKLPSPERKYVFIEKNQICFGTVFCTVSDTKHLAKNSTLDSQLKGTAILPYAIKLL